MPRDKGSLTWSRAAGLAVLSLSTETSRGRRLWNNSSPLGPGPSCTQSRPSTAAARACSSPFPVGMPCNQSGQQGSAPSQVRSPMCPWDQPFLRHFSKASASVKLRSSKKSGRRREARARRRFSRAPCRVLALEDGEGVEGEGHVVRPIPVTFGIGLAGAWVEGLTGSRGTFCL